MQSSRHVLRVTDADSDPQGCYTLKFLASENALNVLISLWMACQHYVDEKLDLQMQM